MQKFLASVGPVVALSALALTGCMERKEGPAATAPIAPQASLPAANPNRNAYFGDLHLHTSNSFDASITGTTSTVDEAYRYAKGEEVISMGRRWRRHTPYDFLAVTDHAEYMGMIRLAKDPKGIFGNTKWPEIFAGPAGGPGQTGGAYSLVGPSGFRGAPPIPEFNDKKLLSQVWQEEIGAAERHYRPGYFTTFVAYEFSPMPSGHNHRNVIFKGPRYPEVPFSSIDNFHPEGLWEYADANRRAGIDSVIINHNSNLSDGVMFSYKDSFGREMTEAYAAQRARNEIATEMSQTKGTSETTPNLSPQDEFAGFEIRLEREGFNENGSYVRQGLQRGMELREKLKINPFKLGIVGGSDAHASMSTTEEDNLRGIPLTPGAPPARSTAAAPAPNAPGDPTKGTIGLTSSGGITGVWAERNTREDIFNALKRKEIFGTSGPRIQVRLFGGFNLPANLQQQRNWVSAAYKLGVPMGGDLPYRRGARSGPRFIMQALKDPTSGNLDRVQIIKLWTKNGQSHEKIWDVAWSPGRTKDARTGKLPSVGNTVNVQAATYSNTIGAVELIGTWSDPEFDPEVPALYYVRVLEIPTPRHSTYAAIEQGRPPPSNVSPWIQERAWSSPIFYEPPLRK